MYRRRHIYSYTNVAHSTHIFIQKMHMPKPAWLTLLILKDCLCIEKILTRSVGCSFIILLDVAHPPKSFLTTTTVRNFLI